MFEVTPGDSLPTLSFDLVVKILSRVPVKFLMQFQRVCKSWKSLISDAKFAKKHFRMSTTHHRLLLTSSKLSPKFVIADYPLSSVFTEVNPTATATKLECPLSNQHRLDHIVGSCHGIICIKLYQSFVIPWNPSIKKFKILPTLKLPPSRNGYYTNYGFGYDHSTDTYKVVAFSWYETVINGSRAKKSQVKVHTMGTSYWRKIQDFPGFPRTETGKFVSGTFNWFTYTNSASKEIIVSLDLEKESYRKLLLPDYGAVVVVRSNLTVLMDCLCILCHSNTFLDVGLMKEYGNKDSWTKLFRFPYMGGVRSGPYVKALYVSEDDQILLQYENELAVFNSKDCTFKTLQIQNNNYWSVLDVCQESLISPCSFW